MNDKDRIEKIEKKLEIIMKMLKFQSKFNKSIQDCIGSLMLNTDKTKSEA